MDLTRLDAALDAKLRARNAPLAAVFERAAAIEVVNEGYAKDLSAPSIASADGMFVYDPSGNRYVDTSLGVGTHIFGHGFVAEAIGARLAGGTLFAAPSAGAFEVAARMQDMLPHFSRFVFCNSGAEATMRAARIARAYSRKPRIALFSGGWHGGNDALLFEEDPAGQPDRPKAMAKSAGLVAALRDSVVLLPYNSPAAFDMIEALADELAMVIVEPAQGSNPRSDVGGFLGELRALTRRRGVLLCFDEIITGFRIAAGGCQEHYGIEADLATYGKVLGGGLPVGAVAGRAEIVDAVTSTAGQRVFLGGTFSANPLVMRAAEGVLRRLSENREAVYPALNRRGHELRDRVNAFCRERGLPVRMLGLGSMNRLLFTDKEVGSRRDRDAFEANKRLQDSFYKYLLLEHAIFVNKNRLLFLSTLHDDRAVAGLAGAINASVEFFHPYLQS